jgi:hypothetical protein
MDHSTNGDRWCIFDRDTGQLLGRAATCYGTFQQLNRLWGKGKWLAFHPDHDDPEHQVPPERIKKGQNAHDGPYQAFPDPTFLTDLDIPLDPHAVIVLPRDDPSVVIADRNDLDAARWIVSP